MDESLNLFNLHRSNSFTEKSSRNLPFFSTFLDVISQRYETAVRVTVIQVGTFRVLASRVSVWGGVVWEV